MVKVIDNHYQREGVRQHWADRGGLCYAQKEGVVCDGCHRRVVYFKIIKSDYRRAVALVKHNNNNLPDIINTPTCISDTDIISLKI